MQQNCVALAGMQRRNDKRLAFERKRNMADQRRIDDRVDGCSIIVPALRESFHFIARGFGKCICHGRRVLSLLATLRPPADRYTTRYALSAGYRTSAGR